MLLMKKLFLLTVLFFAATFSACSHDDVESPVLPEPPVVPEPQPLAIAFVEGNSLKFNVGETKTVHYTITGGSNKTVVKAEMQKADDAYTVKTTPTSATEGTITITAQKPTDNCVLVTVSDGTQSITAEIAVSTNAIPEKLAITIETPGTLLQLLAGYDKTKITELTVIGNLNAEDISMLIHLLPNLAILDMEQVNLKALPAEAFLVKTSLTSVKLPRTLTSIGDTAFYGCSGLTSVTIGNSVTSIGNTAFSYCSSLTSITIPDSVTEIGGGVFSYCSSLTSVTIGNSVTSIGQVAFSYCSSLKSITIPDSVTSIGDAAFYSCSGLTSVTIGNSVTEIGDGAFWNCSSLTSVYCKAKTPPYIITSTAFSGVNATLYVPIGCKAAYAAADVWERFTTIIETQF